MTHPQSQKEREYSVRRYSAGLARHEGYSAIFVSVAQKMCSMGATYWEIAEALKCSEVTLHIWRSRYPEFYAAFELPRETADDRVEMSLYQRACGYNYMAQKIFYRKDDEDPTVVVYQEHVPADVNAIRMWLYNRRHDKWRAQPGEEAGGDADQPRNFVVEVVGGPVRRELPDVAPVTIEGTIVNDRISDG